MLKIAVLVSGGGTNLQALLDASASGVIHSGEISLVVSNKENAYALERAKNHGIKGVVLPKTKDVSNQRYGEMLIELLQTHHIDLVVLAGFLIVLDQNVTDAYEDRIVNIHPSLIPSFCGAGYYGLRVHEAVLSRGVKLTGATVHLVNEIADGGRILAQQAVEVKEGDTPEILQKRVMEEAEWVLLPREVEKLAQSMMETQEEE